jgi:hypothetical protein
MFSGFSVTVGSSVVDGGVTVVVVVVIVVVVVGITSS